MKLAYIANYAIVTAQEFVPLASDDDLKLSLPKLQNDLGDKLYDRLVVNSDPEDLVLYSYDENLVESPDADDYTSFWYGDVGADEIEGLPREYEDYQINADYGEINAIGSIDQLNAMADGGDEAAISTLLGSRSLTDLVQNVLLNNQETMLEMANREVTTVEPPVEQAGPVIRFDEMNEERGVSVTSLQD